MSITSSYGNFNYTDLPLRSYEVGEVVLAAGSTTGQLLFLKEGAVAVYVQGVRIAVEDDPGTVFGELSLLLECPHLADIRALTPSQFYVGNPAMLGYNARALFYVAIELAKRLRRSDDAVVSLLRSRGAGN